MVPNPKVPQHAIHCKPVDNGVNRRQPWSMDAYTAPPEFPDTSCKDGHGIVLWYDVVNIMFVADFHNRIVPRHVILVSRNRL